jgi:hypothetical protein
LAKYLISIIDDQWFKNDHVDDLMEALEDMDDNGFLLTDLLDGSLGIWLEDADSNQQREEFVSGFERPLSIGIVTIRKCAAELVK